MAKREERRDKPKGRERKRGRLRESDWGGEWYREKERKQIK